MIDIETQKENLANAARTVSDGTLAAGAKAKDYGTATAKSVTDNQLVVRFVELGTSASSNAASVAKDVFKKAQTASGKGVEMVGEWPLGEKNVGERAQSTVDTVQEKIDVDQIQDQVSKLRDQIEGVLGTWKESFRPTTPSKAAPAVDEKKANTAVKTKVAPKKTAPKRATAPKSASATKKATAPKSASATKKAAPKKAAPKSASTSAKASSAKKTATAKKAATAKK